MTNQLKSSEIGKFCDCKLVLDIGAHYGEDSEVFLNNFPNAIVHVFEPDPRCIRILREKFNNNSRCVIHECAISDKNDIINWYQSSGPYLEKEDWDCSSSVLEPLNHTLIWPEIKFDKVIKVQSHTLDYFTFGHIDFIWMDVQGAEHLVFEGAKNTLENVRYIYTECTNKKIYKGDKNLQELCSILKGFNCIGVFGDNALFSHI